ncbi:MAG: Rv1681 family radical SAM protein, partial [Vicinamibacterales bacterium]
TDLEAWSRLTGHGIVAVASGRDVSRWVIRRGPAFLAAEEARPIGTRLWLYTNFDCNLRCDYCCVRSSPTAPRRQLGLERVRRIVGEAGPLGVRQFFITGGEPFLLPDIGDIVTACAEAAPTIVLTNGMLFTGRRSAVLESLPRGPVTFQISLDSATPELHDRHRGPGTWRRAVDGIELARAAGFRVRLAATVGTDEEEAKFRAFLDARHVPVEDRVVRRIALRGFATMGVAVGREDLVPELTITADGVYWHPVGADDDDLLVSRDIFPLAAALEQARQALAAARAHGGRLARLFYCA